MATAHKLPSGSWRVQVYAGKGPDGKRQYRSFTALTKKAAEYEALQWQLHYREISRDATAMTLREAVNQEAKPYICDIFLPFRATCCIIRERGREGSNPLQALRH